MSDFVFIPKRNIWRLLFDIRPFGSVFEEKNQNWSCLDLRVIKTGLLERKIAEIPKVEARKSRAAVLKGGSRGDAALPPKQKIFAGTDEERTRIFAPILRKAAVLTAVIAIAAGVFFAGGVGRAHIESQKANIAATAAGIAESAQRGMDLMMAMRFKDAELEFRAAADNLENFERMMAPALWAVSLSAIVLPENDYARTVAMLRDVGVVFGAMADLNAYVSEFIQTAPTALFFTGHNLFPILDSIQNTLAEIESAAANIKANRNPFADSVAGGMFNRFPEMKLALGKALDSFGFLEKFLGRQEPFTVLLLFQNPAEIRATGGFIGSYGVLRMEQGRIAEFKVDDIYNPDGQRELRDLPMFMPPRPLQFATPVWEARDSNWFFDFSISAPKTAELISQVTGVEYDLVIATNPRFVARMIDLAGPIEMPEYGVTITGDNFWEATQWQTRAGRDREINQPKKFLTILGPRLIERMREIDSADLPEAAGIFLESLNKKGILFWSRDKDLQSLIVSRGWGGTVSEIAADEDYLAVALSNIGGAKADYVTRQHYNLKTSIKPSGKITNTLAITRIHEGDRARYPWWNARNITYIRVFVPRGSTLLSISGAHPEPRLIELDPNADYVLDPDVTMTINSAVRMENKRVDVFEESGRTVFGFWHVINPGRTRIITLSWQLPFQASFAPPGYGFLFQRQSGIDGTFQHSIALPRGSSVLNVEPAGDGADKAVLGDRFSWITRDMNSDIRHAISYQLR